MRARVLLVLINLVSLGCLVWTLRDANLGELRRGPGHHGLEVGGLAVVADLGVYLLQAYRWSLLLRPVEPVGFWRSARAVFIGLFANEVLPGHTGEILRCYLLALDRDAIFGLAVQRID